MPSRTLTTYDGAGRETAQIYQVSESEQWRTTLSYDGDRVHVDPPTGSVATTEISDARGRVTELAPTPAPRQRERTTPSRTPTTGRATGQA
ncbi:hypothetical protein [Salana multivorans]